MTKIFVLLCSLLCIISISVRSIQGCVNDYHIPSSQITDFTTLEDYRNQVISRRWDLPSGPIVLSQAVTNAVVLSWRKYETMVNLQTYATIAVEQEWSIAGAHITLTYSAAKAVVQMWNLGRTWRRYERDAAGTVISEGTASDQDLEPYKREIDCWCAANRRFFRFQYCSIYDR